MASLECLDSANYVGTRLSLPEARLIGMYFFPPGAITCFVQPHNKAPESARSLPDRPLGAFDHVRPAGAFCGKPVTETPRLLAARPRPRVRKRRSSRQGGNFRPARAALARSAPDHGRDRRAKFPSSRAGHCDRHPAGAVVPRVPRHDQEQRDRGRCRRPTPSDGGFTASRRAGRTYTLTGRGRTGLETPSRALRSSRAGDRG